MGLELRFDPHTHPLGGCLSASSLRDGVAAVAQEGQDPPSASLLMAAACPWAPKAVLGLREKTFGSH